MKRINHALVWGFAAALLVVSPLVAHAGPKADAQARPHGMAAKAIEVIDKSAANEAVKLDDEQKTKVHAVIEDAMAQAAAMQADRKAEKGQDKSKEDRQAARDKVIELTTNTVGKVEAILTDEQKTAFRTALKEERAKARAERGEHAGDRGAGKGGAGAAGKDPKPGL
jgi:Spy/CpxP family protein refolding chaperone